MDFYRPIFCDKDPEQAAKALDNFLLVDQVRTIATLLACGELIIYDEARKQLQVDTLPKGEPEGWGISNRLSLKLLKLGVVDWAMGSEDAWRWLTLYALALKTEVTNRKLDAICPGDFEVTIHRCFVRINMYGAILRGAKRTEASAGLPRTTPNDLGGNNIIQQTRRLLMRYWDCMIAEPSWGNSVPPSWMDVRGRMAVASAETLVDRSSLQA